MNKKIKLDSNLIFTIIVALIALAYYIVLIVGKYTFEPTNMFYRSFNIFSGAGDPNKAILI